MNDFQFFSENYFNLGKKLWIELLCGTLTGKEYYGEVDYRVRSLKYAVLNSEQTTTSCTSEALLSGFWFWSIYAFIYSLYLCPITFTTKIIVNFNIRWRYMISNHYIIPPIGWLMIILIIEFLIWWSCIYWWYIIHFRHMCTLSILVMTHWSKFLCNKGFFLSCQSILIIRWFWILTPSIDKEDNQYHNQTCTDCTYDYSNDSLFWLN